MSNRSLVSGPYEEDGSQGSRSLFLLHSSWLNVWTSRLESRFQTVLSSQFGIDNTSIERRAIKLKLD